jgi:hypothetical protein
MISQQMTTANKKVIFLVLFRGFWALGLCGMYYFLAGLEVAAAPDFLLASVKSTKDNHVIN